MLHVAGRNGARAPAPRPGPERLAGISSSPLWFLFGWQWWSVGVLQERSWRHSWKGVSYATGATDCCITTTATHRQRGHRWPLDVTSPCVWGHFTVWWSPGWCPLVLSSSEKYAYNTDFPFVLKKRKKDTWFTEKCVRLLQTTITFCSCRV